jgi:CheY-like chemotaxis protein
MLAFCGQGRFVTEPIDVSVLVRELLPLIRTTAKTTTVELDAGVDSAIVDGDSAQLRQAVLNLVTNASEAAATTVRVSLALRDLSVDEIYTCELDATMPPGRYVALTIDDNGSGIGADTRPRVFDPFFSTKFSGRGLGLAVVQGIARTHRGDVSIQSQVGAGTTFTVFLPIATRTPLVDESVAARNDLVGLRILVIEDDEAVARTLMRICKAAKMVGTHARSGEEAVALVEHQTFDLALVDLVMPGMGGAACGAQLRQLRPDLPLVLMTGFGQVPAETATIFETVIGKPYGRTDLLALIARLARRG